MPIPAYMWLKDDGGALIKGGVDVQDREYSIEIRGFHHNLMVEMRYEKITWKHCDGNIIYTDSWNERQTA